MLFKTIDCICCTKERGEAKVLFSKRRIKILVTRTARALRFFCSLKTMMKIPPTDLLSGGRRPAFH